MYSILDGSEIFEMLHLIYKQNINRTSDIPIEFVKKVIQLINDSKKMVNSDEVLSSREFDVLNLIQEDFTNQEIADSLIISIWLKTDLITLKLNLLINQVLVRIIRLKIILKYLNCLYLTKKTNGR